MFAGKSVLAIAAAATAAMITTAHAQQTIRLRIASGHAPAIPYVEQMQKFFAPEVIKRVAARTKYKVEFVEGYGGAMVKVFDTLEGAQSGIIDIGGYCFCFEPSNLPLHAFQVMMPFGTMSPVMSLKIARAVYDQVPFMSKVFEDKYKQKLLAIIADNGYNLGTTFEWNEVSQLKGQKVGGAGLNLKWLEFVGATPVQTSLPEVYTSLQTGVYNGVILFPSAYVGYKLYEPARYYTEIGFGAMTWYGLTINAARWSKIPKEVQDIILEVAREYEVMSGTLSEKTYPLQLAELKKRGAIVRALPEKVRQDWAQSLAAWPAQKAKELDGQGLPATRVMELTIAEAEKLGYKWPVRYKVK
jgi:TRAP-type C4-dicarboxylate transport system substrate-binding protein